MSSKIDKIQALIDRAVHPNTPEIEARTSAINAVKAIRKYKIQLVDSTGREPSKVIPPNHDYWNDPVPDISSATQDIDLFSLKPSTAIGQCVACKKPYNKGVVIAVVPGKGATHHHCKRYWINGNKPVT